MKVDTQPFPSVNMVEGYDRSARRQLDFAFDINMVGPAPRSYARKEKADPCNRPQKGEKEYITEEQVRHVRNHGRLLPISSRSMNTSTRNVSSMNQRVKNMSTILGRV
jgi:hypothetical protein